MIRSALEVMKHCRSEEQRADYHNVMGACAVRRTAEDDDPDGMYARVAAELGVTPYSW